MGFSLGWPVGFFVGLDFQWYIGRVGDVAFITPMVAGIIGISVSIEPGCIGIFFNGLGIIEYTWITSR